MLPRRSTVSSDRPRTLQRSGNGLVSVCTAALVILASWAAVAQPSAPGAAEGEGAEAPKPKSGISHVLGMLDWQATHGDVLAQIKKDIDARYRDRMENADTLTIDRLLKEKRADFDAIERTFVRFTGQRTGYESSLIADDFKVGNDEAVMRVDDQAAQRYYFFKNDRLWKIVVAYNATVVRGVDFPSFVKQVSGKYGAPTERIMGEQAGKPVLVAAAWQDDLTHLQVEDRSEFFATFVMKFIDKSEGLALEKERQEALRAAAKPRASARTDALLGSIMAEEGESGDSDVVDRLTGTRHDVDLAAGQAAHAPVLRRDLEDEDGEPVTASTAKRERGKKGVKKAAPAGKDKRRGAKSGGKGRRDAPAEPAPPAPTANDLIIY